MKWEYSCGAIIYRRNDELEYLIIQEMPGHWFFPKGHVEKGETEEETAKREIFEEVRESVNFISGYKEVMTYFIRSDAKQKVTFFLSELPVKELAFDKKEIKDAKWLNLESALKRLDHDDSRTLLSKTDLWIKSNT